MSSKRVDIIQYLINGAALFGLGVLAIDINRRILMKAFDLFGVPYLRLVWEEEEKMRKRPSASKTEVD